MLRDELQESWAYQEILQEGMIKVLLAIVETHFPELLPQVKALVERERDVPTLECLVITIALAQNAEVAAQRLSNDTSVSSHQVLMRMRLA